MISPYERDMGLLHEVIDNAIASRASIPAVSGDDDFIDCEVADHASGEVDEVEEAASAHEFTDDGLDVGAVAIGGGFVKDFREKFAVFRWENSGGMLEAAAGCEDADDFEEVGEGVVGEGVLLFWFAEIVLELTDDFGGVKDKFKELLEIGGFHFVFEQAFNERAKRARGIVDDMPELFVLAVNIADDVDGSSRQG